jgi:fructose-specific component phosphotransferase system IIB-like protein
MLAVGDKYHNLPEWNGRKMWVEEMARRCKRMMTPSE